MKLNKLFGIGTLLLAFGAQAAYPEKNIVMTVPFAPGGSTDMLARLVAAGLQKQLGQSVVVENVGGAGGTLGAVKVAKANPDGYSLLMTNMGIATAPTLYKNLAFDPLKDFEYIGQTGDIPMLMVSRPGLSVKTLKDLVTYAKANPGKATIAHAGVGSSSQLCSLLFQKMIATDLNTIPYKGTGPAMTDVVGDRIDMMCDQALSVNAFAQAGKVNAVAVVGSQPVASLPNVPLTSKQAEFKEFDLTVWNGLYAPKGTPKEIVDALAKALAAAVVDPEFKRKLGEQGAFPPSAQAATPMGLKNHVASELAKWAPILKSAGVYAD